MTRTEVLAKISTDLAWRGPSGSQLRYVVLERDDAAALLDPTDERALLSEIFRLVGLLNNAMPEGKRAPPPQTNVTIEDSAA
jgi:hypothetical protein